MGNSNFTRFFRVLELVMGPFCVMENPPIFLQPLYYFPTFHYVYYTHSQAGCQCSVVGLLANESFKGPGVVAKAKIRCLRRHDQKVVQTPD